MAREISNGANLKGPMQLAAGTTSLSPLTFQSGTNLTSATAGAMEYDGKVIYSTPASRGVSPSMMFYRLNSGLAGSNVSTVQSTFGVGVALSASTVYSFEIRFALTKTAGTTSHTIAILFGGTATLNNIFYNGSVNGLSATLPIYDSAASSITSNTAGSLVVSSFITSSTYYRTLLFSGTVSINAAGTFIPQYQLSSAPGGAYTTVAGSYMAIWPIGTAGANTSVGPWA